MKSPIKKISALIGSKISLFTRHRDIYSKSNSTTGWLKYRDLEKCGECKESEKHRIDIFHFSHTLDIFFLCLLLLRFSIFINLLAV